MDSIPSASPQQTAVQERATCGVKAASPAKEKKVLVIAASNPPEGITHREKDGSGAAAEVREHGQDPLSLTHTEKQGSPQISRALKQDTGDNADRDVTTAIKKEANGNPPEKTQEHKSTEEDNAHQDTEQGSQDLKNLLAKTPEKAGDTDENKELDEKMTQMQLKSPQEKSLPHLFLSPQKSPPRDSINLTSPSAAKGAVAAAKALTKGRKSPSPKPRKGPSQDQL